MASLLESLSRRRFLAIAAAIPALVVGKRLRTSSAQNYTEHGDCSIIPALEWYRHFATANFVALPSRGLNDHLPQHNWQATEDPELGPFMVPPGWTTDTFFANQFERDGSPIWGVDFLDHPRWTATMVTSPEQEAFYMHIVGAIDDVMLDSPGGAQLSRELAIGKEVETEPLCLMEQYRVEGQIPVTDWLAGETFGDHLLMTGGVAFTTDFTGFNYQPGSRFIIDVLVCPYEQSSEYMQDVFLRILWQFVPKSPGGVGEVTPTPSPTP